MGKIIRKRLVVRLPLAPASSADATDDSVFVGGIRLNAKRKRQTFTEAARDSIERNQEALRKLARR